MGAPEIFDYLELRPYLCAFCAEHALGSATALSRPLARELGCSPSHAYNIMLGFTRAQPADVAPMARFLELDAEREEHLRLLVARQHAEGRERADLALSIWASHAAHRRQREELDPDDQLDEDVPALWEATALTLLPMLEHHAPRSEGPAALARLLLFGPDAADFERALPYRAEAGLGGEPRGPRLRVLANPGSPGTWSNAAWHGALELARAAFIQLNLAERTSFMAVASADQAAMLASWRAIARLTGALRALVKRSAESPVDRLYLSLGQLIHLTPEPPSDKERPETQERSAALTARGRRAKTEVEGRGSGVSAASGRPCLLHYLEFSPFALAWLAWKQSSRKGVSYRSLQKKAGLSKSTLQELFKGSCRLMPAHLPGLVKAMELAEVEEPYLEGLCRLAHTTDVEARASEIRALFAWAEQHGGVRTWASDQFLLRSHWSGAALQKLTELPTYRAHEAWVCRALQGRITTEHARRLRGALMRTGWMGPDGRPSRRGEPEQRREPGEDVEASYAFNFSGLYLARRDLVSPGPRPRARGAVLALSVEDFGRARELLVACQQEILEALRAAERRAQAGEGRLDRVIHVQLQLFPITVPLKGR